MTDIVVRFTAVDHNGKPLPDIVMSYPFDEMILTSYAMSVGKEEPFVRLPLHMHGGGYHTVCRLGPDGEETEERMEFRAW